MWTWLTEQDVIRILEKLKNEVDPSEELLKVGQAAGAYQAPGR